VCVRLPLCYYTRKTTDLFNLNLSSSSLLTLIAYRYTISLEIRDMKIYDFYVYTVLFTSDNAPGYTVARSGLTEYSSIPVAAEGPKQAAIRWRGIQH
jgi:hypothetical protein